MNNSTKSWIFLLAISLLTVFIGHSLAGREGVLWSLIIALSINCYIYFYGDQRILSHFHGRRLEGQDPWGLIEIVKKLTPRAHLPLPKVVIIESESPQALATGRTWRRGTLILSQSLLEALTRKELEAVVAYLTACIHRQDTLAFAIGSSLSGAVLLFANLLDTLPRILIGPIRRAKEGQESFLVQPRLFTYLLAPLAGLMLRLSVTPTSYYAIDSLAATYIDDPKVLAEALWKLESLRKTKPFRTPSSLAPLFIVNPLTAGSWTRYFQVQPSVERRIRKLIGYYPI